MRKCMKRFHGNGAREVGGLRRRLSRLMLAVVLGASLQVGALNAEHMPVTSEGPIRATADYCVFRGDSTASYVEVYLQVVLEGLTFSDTPEGDVTMELEFEAFLTDPNRGRFAVREWKRSVRLPSREQSRQSGLSLFDLLDLALPPGEYEVDIGIREVGGSKEATLSMPLLVCGFTDAALAISDIQFARQTEKATTEGNLFVKSGYEMVPNPSRRYGQALPELCFYAEVYGLQEEVDRFTVQYEVADMEGEVLFSKGPFFKKKSGRTAVLVGAMPVADFVSGFYRLSVAVADSTTFDVSSGTTRSSIFLRAEEESEIDTTPWALSPAESTAAEMELRYVASANEIRLFRELNPVGRAQFLEQFWAKRDPDPSTPENEERELLHQRIAFAQQELNEMRKQGMDTDRGRVYIKYGPPHDISRMAGDLTCKDNEIWHYHLEVERIFVFVDEFNTNVYRLIHSNYPGEVERPNWELIVCQQSHTQTFD
jgi:GWxTD domain-containing protein